MDATQAENLIEKAILKADLSVAYRWIIVVRSKKVRCVPRSDRFHEETMIAELSRGQIEFGLTTEMWSAFGLRLAQYWKEQNL